jgi:four helix bundle protein
MWKKQLLQSARDFIHKMSIALKEARETRYWLRLLEKSVLVNMDVIIYLDHIHSIINILSRIIITAKTNINKIQN